MASNVINIIVDANIWISYFNQDDTLYHQAKEIVDTYLQDDRKVLMVTDYILQEVITIFLYDSKPGLIDEFMEFINTEAQIEILNINSYFFTTVVDYIKQFSYKPKMSLTDWSLLFLAQELNCTLLTFDKQLYHTYKKLSV